jgi:hypothetical protein
LLTLQSKWGEVHAVSLQLGISAHLAAPVSSRVDAE